MAASTEQPDINNILWRACDTFRGTVDPFPAVFQIVR